MRATMKTSEWVEVWDDNTHTGDSTHHELGVNWCAVGPVPPAVARRFARHILKAADKMEELKAAHKQEGHTVCFA